MVAGLLYMLSLGWLQVQKGAKGGGEVPFALFLDSCTRLAQPHALGLAMHGLTKYMRLEQTSNPRQAHVLFGLNLN